MLPEVNEKPIQKRGSKAFGQGCGLPGGTVSILSVFARRFFSNCAKGGETAGSAGSAMEDTHAPSP
jgi:hypothetical protein